MNEQPLGIRFVPADSKDAVGVYESDSGIETFETDAPYLLTDWESLIEPLPVFNAGDPVFKDSMGNAQILVLCLYHRATFSWLLFGIMLTHQRAQEVGHAQ